MSPPSQPTSTKPGPLYQTGQRTSDRSQPCPNRNGFWPPIYQRQWQPHPARKQHHTAQRQWQRCVLDAVETGELHRTTGLVLLAFSRYSDDWHSDVWVSQATVAERLGLGEDTVCHHVAKAKSAGWVHVQHRNTIHNGRVRAMTNITRLTLPDHWVEHLATQARQRATAAADRRRAQAAARPGRVTPRTPERPTGSHDIRPPSPTPAAHAASFGAGEARTATNYDAGIAAIDDQYRDTPALAEAAKWEFTEVWKRTRMNR